MDPTHHNLLSPAESMFREKLTKTLLRKIIREREAQRSGATFYKTTFYLMKIKDHSLKNQFLELIDHVVEKDLPIEKKTHYAFQEFHKILYGSYKEYPETIVDKIENMVNAKKEKRASNAIKRLNKDL